MSDCNQLDMLCVTTTVGALDDALRLARGLVEARLAACVQLDEGVRSIYRWEGALCDEAEVRLVIKTLPQQEAALRAWFAEHHPYDVPQFLAHQMRASDDYARWVRAEVTPA